MQLQHLVADPIEWGRISKQAQLCSASRWFWQPMGSSKGARCRTDSGSAVAVAPASETDGPSGCKMYSPSVVTLAH